MAHTLSATETTALLFPDLSRELAKTRRALERFPAAHADWQPHAKSRSLAALATHMAAIPMQGSRILQLDEFDIAGRVPPPPAASAEQLLATFDDGMTKLTAALAAATPADLERPWTLRAGDKVLITGPRRELLRDVVLNHGVHHRAQLGVYYRLLDVPVPGTYGPSADEF